MININLLPWRNHRREQEKREFFIKWGASLFFTLILWGLVHIALTALLHSKERSNEFVRNRITGLAQKLQKVRRIEEQKTTLLSQIKTLQPLESKQASVIHLLDDIAHRMPDGIYLTTISREKDTILLTGRAESNPAVSTFIQRLETSRWLTHPILKETKTVPLSTFFINEFTLQVKEKK